MEPSQKQSHMFPTGDTDEEYRRNTFYHELNARVDWQTKTSAKIFLLKEGSIMSQCTE